MAMELAMEKTIVHTITILNKRMLMETISATFATIVQTKRIQINMILIVMVMVMFVIVALAAMTVRIFYFINKKI